MFGSFLVAGVWSLLVKLALTEASGATSSSMVSGAVSLPGREKYVASSQ